MTIAGNGNVSRSGDTVTVPYTIGGTNSGNVNRISVLITDKVYTDSNAQILHYGSLDTSAGNGTFTLPAELSDKVCGTDYYAYIIAEDVNGNYETDYASTPVSITVPAKPWEAPTVNAINIGTPGIIDPAVPGSTSDAWKGCYVYFGKYDTDGDGIAEPIKYRVLDSETSVFGGTTMLLDCDSILWAGTNGDNQSSAFDDDSNVWANSNIKTYLNGTFLTSNFSTAEQNAIASSTKSAADGTDGNGWSYLSYASLSDDKIFFLDAKEATNTSYGYSNTDGSAVNRKKTGGNAYWWLRSAYTNGTLYAGLVDSDGSISISDVTYDDVGVSPAFNINLSSVLFSSVSGTSKSSALTAASSQIGETTGTEWKLTLADTGKTVQVIEDKKVIKAADGTITVPYTYTDAATAEAEKVNQISVMITDKAYAAEGVKILYYGALQDIKDANESASIVSDAATGTGTFELPGGLTGTLGTDYHVYILAEHVNENSNATDYASTPVEITATYVADSSGESSDSGSGSSSSSGSSGSGNTSGGTSSGSSNNTNTNTDTSTKVPYDDVPISTGSVNDITGTASATAESNPFGTKIENSSNLTKLLSLTDAEVAQGVNVWLDIQDMSSSVSKTDKSLIQDKSGDYTVGLYLDINLFKKVGSNDATKVTETKGKVKASIVIPENLRKSGRTFEIIRVHDGVATAIAGTYDESTHVFTFETDKFSTYALAYKDDTSSDNNSSTSDSSTSSDSSSSNSSNSTQSTAPKTGDPNDIRVWYLLLIASLGGLGLLGLSKKKEN